MSKLSILKGATSVIVRVFVRDSSSTTGAGLTGLAYNTASLTCYRMRDDDGNAGATAITLATMTRGTWASGGFVEKDATNSPGWYEFGIPNNALASGSRSVDIHFKGATNMAPLPIEIELTGWDNQDAVRGGMTALPNAAAEAAGGLYTRGSGAGQINQVANGMIDANVVRNAGTAITSAAGRQEVNVTHLLGTAWLTPATAGTPDVNVKTLTNNAITAASINADAITDAKVASDVTIASVTGSVGSVTGNVGGSVASVVGLTASNLDATISSRASATNLATVAGYIDTEITDIQNRLPAALVSGRMDSSTGAMAANTLTASALATDAVTEIQTGLASAADLATLTGYVDTEVAAIKAKTDSLTFTVPGMVDSNVVDWKGATAPAMTGDAYARLGAPAGASVSADIAAVQSDTDNIQTRIPAALVSGRMDSSVGAMANDTLTAAALATDAVTEIQSGLATSSALATVAGYIDTEVAAIKAKTDNLPSDPADASDIAAAFSTVNTKLDTIDDFLDTEISAIKAKTDNLPASPAAVSDIPTASAISDAVWDEAISGHAVSGSTGEALSAAGASGDPWITALPGSYSAGQAGYILGTNLDVPVSTVSGGSLTASDIADEVETRTIAAVTVVNGLAANSVNASALASDAVTEIQSGLATASALSTLTGYVDTEVAAIKAKTDNLPASPAAVGDVPTALQNADALLNRDMAAVSDTNSRTPLNAFRFIRNGFTTSGSTLSVLKENDSTVAYTRDLTTDPAAEPIVGVN